MRDAAEELRAGVARGDWPAAALVVSDRTTVVDTVHAGRTEANGVAVTERTRFRWASCSKPVTALAAMVAVEEGLVDLDAPLTRVLPDFRVRSRFGGDPATELTLRHLLSHTGGLTRQAPVDNSVDDWPAHVASISDTWLRFPVGQRYAYSDIGIDLVGHALEVASGRPFPEFVASRVFAPAGMDDATFARAVVVADASRAIGHIEGKRHALSGMVPAGSMHASTRDLARFLRVVLGGGSIDGTRVVAAGLLDEMATVPFPLVGQTEGYALGVRTRAGRTGRRIGHAGRGFGFLADLWWRPDDGVGAAAVVTGHDHDLRGTLVPRLLARLAGVAPTADTPPPVPASPAPGAGEGDPDPVDERWLGRYAGGLHHTIEIGRRDGSIGIGEGDRFRPLRVTAPCEVVTADHQAERYRFVDDPRTPRYVVRVRDGESWSYNDGPCDPPGPDRPAWRDAAGEYEVVSRDGLTWPRVPVGVQHGYLTIASQRIVEQGDHLVSPRGEEVELDASRIRVGNRVLVRVTRGRSPGTP